MRVFLCLPQVGHMAQHVSLGVVRDCVPEVRANTPVHRCGVQQIQFFERQATDEAYTY